MIGRIAVAAVTLYLLHGAEASRQDATRIAGELRSEAPRALVSTCLDHADLCRDVIRHSTGLPLDPGVHTGKIAPKTAAAQPQPVPPETYPLPPARPSFRNGLPKAP